MYAETYSSTVKTYLFFLFISLFTVSGCGLDIDFGGSNNNEDVEKNEVIMGFIKEVTPDISEGSNLIVKANLIKDEAVACCEDTTSENDDFYIEGNLDPKSKLQFFETGNEEIPLGIITIPVFPGATIDIQDINIINLVVTYSYVNINFEGQVISKNCLNDTSKNGNITVEILSEGIITEVRVNLTSSTDIERGDEDNLPCEEIVVERKVRIDGKLELGETVNADLVDIL